MIKVVFKKERGNYGTDEFTYKNYEGVEIDDEVLVETRYGLALAKVTQVDVEDDRFSEENLVKSVVSIVLTAKAKREKEEAERKRKQELERIKRNIKRARMTRELMEYVEGADRAVVMNLTDEELNEFYKEVTTKTKKSSTTTVTSPLWEESSPLTMKATDGSIYFYRD